MIETWANGQAHYRTAAVNQMADNLSKKEENCYRLLELLREPAYISTLDNKVVYANHSTLGFFGCTRKVAIGMDVSDIFVDPDEWERLRRKVEHDGIVRDYEVKLCKMNKVEIDCHLTSTLHLANNDSILGYQSVIYPIVEAKWTKDKLEHNVQNMMHAMKSTIEAMAATTELRDPYTAGHQRRVADLAIAIGKEMGCSENDIEGIRMAAVVHDIGKIYVPAEILSKPGQLNGPEFALIQMHPKCGYDILKNIESPWPIADIVLQHHMRLNGSGYPDCDGEQELMPQSKILAVADVVEAISSHRPYREGLGINKALEEISQNKGILFDVNAVDACVGLITQKGFSLG